MERRKNGNGWETFFEHWGLFLPMTVIGITASMVLPFLGNMSGTRWICFFIASTVLLFLGAGLILYAKFPVNRSGRFFTFGVKSVPEHLAGFYRWGWRLFLVGVGLSLWLLFAQL